MSYSVFVFSFFHFSFLALYTTSVRLCDSDGLLNLVELSYGVVRRYSASHPSNAHILLRYEDVRKPASSNGADAPPALLVCRT